MSDPSKRRLWCRCWVSVRVELGLRGGSYKVIVIAPREQPVYR